jgi:hypothetical protein
VLLSFSYPWPHRSLWPDTSDTRVTASCSRLFRCGVLAVKTSPVGTVQPGASARLDLPLLVSEEVEVLTLDLRAAVVAYPDPSVRVCERLARRLAVAGRTFPPLGVDARRPIEGRTAPGRGSGRVVAAHVPESRRLRSSLRRSAVSRPGPTGSERSTKRMARQMRS